MLLSRLASALQTLFRLVAILGLFVICLLPLHKGYMDFTTLAQKYSGHELWLAFGRYLFRNMAGGG